VSRPIAFVTPRYGDDVVGGSEAVMREAAQGLAQRGHAVEVLTTCARDHYTWANEFPAGEFEVDGLTLRRFPTVHDGSRMDWEATQRRIMLGLPVTEAEEVAWVSGHFRVPALFHHLLSAGDRYRAVILSPYLFWTTLVGAMAVPDRTVVMPCLHDEPYAYLSVVRRLLASSAQLWFLSEPERQLALRLGPVAADQHVTGAGVPVPAAYDPDGFRARHGLGDRPFALYVGRRETGKGWDALVAGYASATARGVVDLDLVSVGVGKVEVPPELDGRLLDLGFVAASEISDAFAAATVYLQPSPNESFSRTVMEAWLAGTPVVASAASEVVAWHCERSGAGLVYADDAELAECLALASAAPDVLRSLAAPGRDYVLGHYSWDAVLDRMEKALAAMP
jgi:glycosyltransferase involved in cell wall biosynthesis